MGAHFCKFHICLPGAPAAPIDYGWSGAMLVEPGVFRRAGGFPDTYWAGDTMLSGRLRQAGYTLWFASSAIAAHDHLQLTLRALVRERFLRGREFGRMAVGGLIGSERLTDFELLRKALTTVTLPLLVLLALGNIARQAAQAGKLRSFLWTLPVVAAGRAAWALGVAAGYWDEVFQRRHLPQPS